MTSSDDGVDVDLERRWHSPCRSASRVDREAAKEVSALLTYSFRCMRGLSAAGGLTAHSVPVGVSR